MHLSQMFVHPLKSAHGIEYSRAYAGFQGLLHDREWMLTTEEGISMSARDWPEILRIQVNLVPGCALFKYPGADPIMALFTQYHSTGTVHIEEEAFTAYYGDPRLDAWFTRALSTPCRLVWLGLHSQRKPADNPNGLSFADRYPYKLLNIASLQKLNQQLDKPVSTRHFRPNLVIEGALPFEEDHWKRVRLGMIAFDVVKPSDCCLIATMDPDTGALDPDWEPLQTLSRLRQTADGVSFGVYLRARNEGILHTGAFFEVVETTH